jgi:hypothetical protein
VRSRVFSDFAGRLQKKQRAEKDLAPARLPRLIGFAPRRPDLEDLEG